MNNHAIVRKASPYAYYVLIILTIAYVFNFIDRTIISILAEEIKEDLKVDDASLGFLYGTAFAVFFSIFGLPLARLADNWNRKKIIGWGIFLWSIMTALSGTANSFILLALYRVGVGVGESAMAPAAMSMLSDSFPRKSWATAYAFLGTGLFIGSGAGYWVGGTTLDLYHRWYPTGNAPFGIADWQMSMFLVGLPGIILAMVVFLMREPRRGQMEGLESQQQHPDAFKLFLGELASVVPPFTVLRLLRMEGGAKMARRNALYGSMLALTAFLLTLWLGSPVQWLAIALGLYSFISWLQRLQVIDYPCFSMVFKAKAMRYSILGFSLIGLLTYSFGFWFAPYLIRRFHATPKEVGEVTGMIVFGAGVMSILIGGYLSDYMRKSMPAARPYMGILSMLAVPFYVLAVTSDQLSHVYMYSALGIFFGMIWIPSSNTISSELVPPRMRATSIAFNALAGTLLGLAIGPYVVGEISDSLFARGYTDVESLQTAMLCTLAVVAPMAVALLVIASRHVEVDENTIMERAAAAGERT